jgi:ribulose 1,5-bisphosphate synthetase/thiazole synthase
LNSPGQPLTLPRATAHSASSAQELKKTQPEEFDLVILGGGTGSTIAAWTFAGEGKKVAVVDRKYALTPSLPVIQKQKAM